MEVSTHLLKDLYIADEHLVLLQNKHGPGSGVLGHHGRVTLTWLMYKYENMTSWSGTRQSKPQLDM